MLAYRGSEQKEPPQIFQFITIRNEVAKVMFLHLSVILFTGGCLP